MAHHITELISAAEADDGDTDIAAAKSRAVQEILLLWSHRTTMPRPYPLESFDRIFAALDRLEDPSASNRLSRYFGDNAPSEPELAVTPLLEVAARVDDDVSDVIACLIAEAVSEAEDADARWVPIAMEIAEDQNTRALRRLMSTARRRRNAATRTRPLAAEGDVSAAPSSDANTADAVSADGTAVDEPTTGGANEENAATNRDALVDALDRASATLDRLRSSLTDSTETGSS